MMKKNTFRSAAVILTLVFIIGIVSCDQIDLNNLLGYTEKSDQSDVLWANATYNSDTILGNGSKTVIIDIEAEDKKITIILKTDKNTLGAALYEQDLINDASFFDTLNGIKADWNKDNAYWAFYDGDSYATYGVNDAAIDGGEHFRFVYSK